MATQVGTDQFIPDDMEDNSMGFSQAPGGDGFASQKATPGGGGGNNGVIMTEATELNEAQKLQLAERANEIYRQQLKYMQDHLASLRSLIQDKENIIENLMLRYDLGIITQDQNRVGGNLSSDEMEMEELRRKAEALAQRTILENFELREMVNELRDENFHLRNEIYELQDKINRQVLQINKLEKQAALANTIAANNAAQSTATTQARQNNNNNNNGRSDIGTGMDGMYGDNDDDIYGDIEEQYEDDGLPSNDQPQDAHGRGASITGNDWLNDQTPSRGAGRRQSETMDPSQSAEAIAKRNERNKKERQPSIATPDIFGAEQMDSEDDDPTSSSPAQAKRAKRANKARQDSIATPDMFGDQQGDSVEDSEEDDDGGGQAAGTKRRGSQVWMDDAARQKREERKNHRRGSSVAAPNMFSDDYDPEKYADIEQKRNGPDAQQKRLARKAKRVAQAAVTHVKQHRRKESLAEKLLLGPMEPEDDDLDIKAADPEERKRIRAQARNEQRRKSRQIIKAQVGAKEHFSDDDVEAEEKPQRTAYKARKKNKKGKDTGAAADELEDFEMPNPQTTNNKKRGSVTAESILISETEKKPQKHRRDSSAPVPDLGFEDPEVLLHYERLKVQDMEKQLDTRLNELDKIKQERDTLSEQIQLKSNAANQASENQTLVQRDLDEAVKSKQQLAQKCAMEIMRLTAILNTLQNNPSIKEIVALLIEETIKDQNKNGSLLGWEKL